MGGCSSLNTGWGDWGLGAIDMWNRSNKGRDQMGWTRSSFEERRDKAVLNFRVRICLIDGNKWVRRIFEWGRDASNWDGMCNRIRY